MPYMYIEIMLNRWMIMMSTWISALLPGQFNFFVANVSNSETFGNLCELKFDVETKPYSSSADGASKIKFEIKKNVSLVSKKAHSFFISLPS